MRQQELERENSELKAEIKNLRQVDLESFDVIRAYTHWLFNAEPDFIEKAWKDNPMLAEHFKLKLTSLVASHRYFMSCGDLARFDRELSENNREILYRYILENHLNKW
jgi:hypothetical protein